VGFHDSSPNISMSTLVVLAMHQFLRYHAENRQTAVKTLPPTAAI